MKIAIIGAGLSGSNVLKTILEHPNVSKEDSIDIFEPNALLGPGMPYAPDDRNVMLNSQPKNLSVDKDNKEDFIEWLEANYEAPTNFEGLVARPRYGQYLMERFKESFSHPQVTHYQEKIVDMNIIVKNKTAKEETNYVLTTESGEAEIAYDAVFFAIGHPPYKDDYDLKDTINYIHNPYPLKEELSQLDENQKIGIIGSGAASIDYFRYVTQNYELTSPLTFYVHDDAFLFPLIPYAGNKFNFTISKKWIVEMKEKNNGFIPFEIILQTIIKDLKNSGAHLSEIYQKYQKMDLLAVRAALNANDQELALIQAYVSELGPLLPHLFNALNGVEREQYLEQYHEKLLFFRNLIPHQTALDLLTYFQEGKVRVVYGIEQIIPQTNQQFKIIANDTEYTDILINGTGFQNNLEKASQQDELIYNLFKKKLILPHRQNDFILVDWPQCRMMNQRFGVLDNAFFLGHYIKGSQHENNNAEMIIEQARFTSQWFMDQVK